MDYKYIEQLLERYWAAETSLEEEGILRAFFSQKDIPAELEQYRALFCWEAEEADVRLLDDDFDARILALTEKEPQVTVKAREISMRRRLMPLFKAAAVVAIFLTIGGALQRPWDASWNDPRVEYANSFPTISVDSADVTPMQAENISETPADTAQAVPVAVAKD